MERAQKLRHEERQKFALTEQKKLIRHDGQKPRSLKNE